MEFFRWKTRAIARILTRFPSFSRVLMEAYRPWESEEIPWAPIQRPLRDCKVALVTTAGVHRIDQATFDMHDPDGDPTFRTIDRSTASNDFLISHDYYDHADADRDINTVFPIDRLREIAAEGVIGEVSEIHYGFMGHVEGPHIYTLLQVTAPEIARRLKLDAVDVVLLTPG